MVLTDDIAMVHPSQQTLFFFSPPPPCPAMPCHAAMPTSILSRAMPAPVTRITVVGPGLGLYVTSWSAASLSISVRPWPQRLIPPPVLHQCSRLQSRESQDGGSVTTWDSDNTGDNTTDNMSNTVAGEHVRGDVLSRGLPVDTGTTGGLL